MSDPDPDTIKRHIRDITRNQPLGDGQRVRCGDCTTTIDEGDPVKGYVMGDADGRRWKLAKVFHPDCGSLFTVDRINANDDTDALVTGTLVHDPSVSAGGPDETTVTRSETATFISAPRGIHRLEDPEVTAISLMSTDRKQKRQEAIQEAEGLMENIKSDEVDHPFAQDDGDDST